jgi:hypothetical protein
METYRSPLLDHPTLLLPPISTHRLLHRQHCDWVSATLQGMQRGMCNRQQ